MPHQLETITDPKNRYSHLEYTAIGMRSVLCVHAVRTARENNARHTVCFQLHNRGRIMIDLREDLAFADAASDNLGELRPEIEDGDGLRHEQFWQTTSQMPTIHLPQER